MEELLSLAEASKLTGYHQDYLGALCRSGKLQGQKIGRNWVVSKRALERFSGTAEGASPIKPVSEFFDVSPTKPSQYAKDDHDPEELLDNLKRSVHAYALRTQGAKIQKLEHSIIPVLQNQVTGMKQNMGVLQKKIEEASQSDSTDPNDTLESQHAKAFNLATGFVSLATAVLLLVVGLFTLNPFSSQLLGTENAGVSKMFLSVPVVAVESPQLLEEGKVLGKTIPATKQASQIFIDERYLNQIVATQLQNLHSIGLLRGPKGDKGDPGQNGVNGTNGSTSYSAPSIPSFVPQVTYNPTTSTTSFSANNLTCDTCIVQTGLTVNGNAEFRGAVNFTGTSSLSLGASSPDASSILELDSNSKGFLAPRMTEVERDAIVSPATGLLIYNTTTDQFNVYTSSNWTTIGGGGSSSIWSALTTPTGNLSLSMATNTSTFSWATGTSTNNLFNLTTANSSNGTGYLLNVATGTASTVKPLRITSAGTDALTINASAQSTFGGKTTFAASTSSNSSINIPSGAAPSSPVNGDFWNQSGSLKFYDGATSQTLTYSADLANTSDSAKGDALVGFKQTATGSVARTVHDKLNEIVSITDFGAVGDGSTNNATAIQAAINNGGQVIIPEGTFNFGNTITLKKDTTIIGKGKSSILRFTGSGVALRENVGSYTGGYDNLKLKDFTLTTNSATSTTGIELTDNYQVTIDGLYIDGNNQAGYTTAGIHIKSSSSSQNSAIIRITNGEIWLVGGDAIRTSGDGGVAAVWIEHMHLTGAGGWGVNETIPGPPYPQSNLQIVNNVIEGNVGGAVNIDNAQATSISGNYFENITGSTATLVRLSSVGAPRGIEIKRNVFGGKSANYLITLLSGSGMTGEISNNTFSSAAIAAINATDTRGLSIFNNFNDGSIPSMVAVGSAAQSLFIQDGSGVQLTAGSLAPQPTLTISGSVVSPLFTYTNNLAITTTASNGNITLTPHGTGSVRVASGVTTGTGIGAGLSVAANSVTSGQAVSVSSTSLTSGSLLTVTVASTAAASNTQTALSIATSGANATSTQTTYGAQISNTHTGTSSVNIGSYINASGGTSNYGLYATASGGTNNFAAVFEQGNVGIGTVTPTLASLQINKDSTYSSESAGALYVRSASADSSLILGSDATNDISYIQSLQNGTSFTSRPLALQPNGGNVVIGSASSSVCCSVNAALKISAGSDAPLYITNGSTDFFYINPVGNVGLGSITASSKLSVYGNAAVGSGYVSTTAPNNGLIVEGNVGVGVTAPGSRLHVQQSSDSAVTATPIAFDVNSSGATGELTASSGNQTFARIAPVVNQSSTAGYTALLVNATETATGSGAHYIFDLQTGGASKFSVQSDGTVITASTLYAGNDLYIASTGYLGFGSRSKISSPSDGQIQLMNNAASGFTSLLFGGTTASFPALKRNGAALAARLADDSADASFSAGAAMFSGSLTFNGVTTDVTTGTNEALLIAPNGTGSVVVLSGVTSGNGSASGLAVIANTNSLSSGALVSFSSNSTAATGNTQQILNISTSGANSTASQLTYGASISNTHTGTGSVNIALDLQSSGGAANYSLYAGSGDAYFGGKIGIGTNTPSRALHVYSTLSGEAVVRIEEPAPRVDFLEGDAAADNKLWRWRVNGEQMLLSATSDDLFTTVNAITVDRTGASIDQTEITMGNFSIATSGAVLNLASAADGNTFVMKIPQKATTGTCSSAGSEGLRIENTGGTQVGHICIDGPTSSTPNKLRFYAEQFNGTATDVAENYSDTVGTLEPGDVVMLDPLVVKGVVKAQVDSLTSVVGIISTRPGILLSGIDESTGETDLVNPVPVALSGRVPVKVSLENGPIAIGDSLTLSLTKPGYVMKAVEATLAVGTALENYFNSYTPGSQTTEQIEVFVNIHQFIPRVAKVLQNSNTPILDSGDMSSLSLVDASVFPKLVVTDTLYVQKDLHVKGVLYAAEIKVEKLTTKELCIDDVCVTKTQLQMLLDRLQDTSSVKFMAPKSNSQGGEGSES